MRVDSELPRLERIRFNSSNVVGFALALSCALVPQHKLLWQRDRRNFNDMLIIDVDAHHYETESMKEIVEFIEDPVLRQLAKSAQQIAHRGSMFSLGRVGYQDIGRWGTVGH